MTSRWQRTTYEAVNKVIHFVEWKHVEFFAVLPAIKINTRYALHLEEKREKNHLKQSRTENPKSKKQQKTKYTEADTKKRKRNTNTKEIDFQHLFI